MTLKEISRFALVSKHKHSKIKVFEAIKHGQLPPSLDEYLLETCQFKWQEGDMRPPLTNKRQHQKRICQTAERVRQLSPSLRLNSKDKRTLQVLRILKSLDQLHN